jgi:hypothetical protein
MECNSFVIMKADRLNTPPGIYAKTPYLPCPPDASPCRHSRTVINHPPRRPCPFNPCNAQIRSRRTTKLQVSATGRAQAHERGPSQSQEK